MTQQQYIANWHDSFVAYIVGMKGNQGVRQTANRVDGSLRNKR